MTSSIDIWFEGNQELIWDRFCGHLHYGLPTFMHIQETLLLEQIKKLLSCELGRKVLGNNSINSIDDFRRKVSLTEYKNYEPYLSEKREDVLPEKPRAWALTTGIEGQQKWAPMSPKTWDVCTETALSLYILSTSSRKGSFSLKTGDVMFNIAPPRPFFAGIGIRDMSPIMGLKLVPPDTEEFNVLPFLERIERGFQMALHTGMDIMAGIGSMISTAGQTFKMPLIPSRGYLSPHVVKRKIKAIIESRGTRRDLLPKQVWTLKSVLATGSDLPAFMPRIEHYWGARPFEFYVNTECLCTIGSLSWNRKFMSFSPYAGLLEFLSQEEANRMTADPIYQPRLRLLNEVMPGMYYELVFTNFHGGIFTRYRTGDLIQFISLGDEETGIKLPQFIIKGRIDKLINIGNFTRLDEKTIWQALENSGIKYNSWLARKEMENGNPVVRIYLDCPDKQDEKLLCELLHQKIKDVDPSYANLESLAGLRPLRVSLFPEFTLTKWEDEMLKAGRDITWIRAQRMQASDEVMEGILKLIKKRYGINKL